MLAAGPDASRESKTARELMKRWIDESYRAIADKKLLAMLS